MIQRHATFNASLGHLVVEQKRSIALVTNITCVSILNNRMHRNARQLKPFHRIPVGFRLSRVFMMDVTID